MTYFHKTNPLVPPPSLAIPAGKYIDIDAKFFTKPPKPVHGQLTPAGSGINYQPSEFVAAAPPMSLSTGSLKVNFGSYIYQPATGFDNAHNPYSDKRQRVESIFI